MNAAALTSLVRETALGLGFDLIGIAPAGPSPDYGRFQSWLEAGCQGEMSYLTRRAAERADPRSLLPEARSVIVLGANYFVHDLPTAWQADPSRGLIASYAWGEDYHDVLKPLLFQLDAAIRSASGRTTLGRAYVDTGPILERSWAAAAGLGFIGKNTCLIAPKRGSWLFLAVLLVPEVLEYGRVADDEWRQADGESAGLRVASGVSRTRKPADPQTRPPSPCGACTRCLDICPTRAFPEPYVLDSRRCISYLTIEHRGPIPHELRPLLGNWIFGCDLCQLVCPYNRRFARPTSLAAFQPRPEMAAPKLLDLLALDEAGFRQRFRRSPVRRAKRRGLLRNVCVALGNWGHPDAVPGLIAALHDEEPLIRGHAAWALGQIGTSQARQALQQRVDQEPVEAVRAELSRALA